MNKAELISAIAEKSGLSKKDSSAALEAFIDSVCESLKKSDKVSVVGFGSFEAKKRAARVGRDPRTKAEINIPESIAPVFKAGKAFKDAISK